MVKKLSKLKIFCYFLLFYSFFGHLDHFLTTPNWFWNMQNIIYDFLRNLFKNFLNWAKIEAIIIFLVFFFSAKIQRKNSLSHIFLKNHLEFDDSYWMFLFLLFE